MSQPERILIGRIGSPWGVQGFNWVQLFTETPEAAFQYRPWVLRKPDPIKKGQYIGGDIEVAKPKGKAQAKGWVCKLSSDATRNSAEAHKGLEIWVALDVLPDLPEGEVYHHQLPGCLVTNARVSCWERSKPFSKPEPTTFGSSANRSVSR